MAKTVPLIPVPPSEKKTKEYRTWLGARWRSGRDVGYYGVRFCRKWKDNYWAFLEHIGRAPSPDHSIDRYPNPAGHYEPGNVRWATQAQQQSNKTTSRFVTHNGKTLHITAWCREVGISVGTVVARLSRGWTFADAISIPPAPYYPSRVNKT